MVGKHIFLGGLNEWYGPLLLNTDVYNFTDVYKANFLVAYWNLFFLDEGNLAV